MEPVTLAAAVVVLLKAFVDKAADQFAGEAGRAVWDKTAALFGRLRSAFANDDQARRAMDAFELEPTGRAAEMQTVLAGEFQRNALLLAEVEALVADIEQAGPQVSIVQKIKIAEDVVGLEGKQMHRGRASISQEAEHATRMLGAKIDEIG